jgi:hypothetical protein
MTAVDTVRRAVDAAWPRIAHLLAPAGIYLAVRVVGVVVLALMAAANGSDVPGS